MRLLGFLLFCGCIWAEVVSGYNFESTRITKAPHIVSGPRSGQANGRWDMVEKAMLNCKEHWFMQEIDHFGWEVVAGLTSNQFAQRYFVCSDFWTGDGPVFFYAGNEADVTLYLNATGLMWENAPSFRALLIFAEHRYFGHSLPFGADTINHMNYLSSEQALADYATLIYSLSSSLFSPDTPVIAFGGSYGGMLASWLRMKYPSAVDGAIAASAPILSFLGQNPPYDSSAFAKTVTDDASPNCQAGIRQVWQLIIDYSKTSEGLAQLTQYFRLCTPLQTPSDAMDLYGWISGAASYLAMGDYPYSTSYITNGGCNLPPWPMDVACSAFDSNITDPAKIFSSARDFAGVFYNCSQQLPCFDLNQSVNNETLQDGEFWDYLWCTEITQPFSQNGVTDMFWPSPFNLNQSSADCLSQWGVQPRPYWAHISFGGRKALKAASNIVFSNGALDPWKNGGVLYNVSDSVVAILIDRAAHHLDLMFSNPKDTPEVIAARKIEVEHIKLWIQQKQQRSSTKTDKESAVVI